MPCARESHTTVTFTDLNYTRKEKEVVVKTKPKRKSYLKKKTTTHDSDSDEEEKKKEIEEEEEENNDDDLEQVLLFGGTDGRNDLNDTWILDPNTWTWRQVEFDPTVKLPPARSEHTAVVHNDHMWVFGGTNGNRTLDDFWCLDLETMVWSEVVVADNPHKNFIKPEARQAHTATIVNMTQILKAKEIKSKEESHTPTKSSHKGESISPGLTKSSSNLSISGMSRSTSSTSIKSDDGSTDEFCMIIIAGYIKAATIGMGTCYNDVWAYSFFAGEWLCLSDPAKTKINDVKIEQQVQQNRLMRGLGQIGNAVVSTTKSTVQIGVNTAKRVGGHALDGVKSLGTAVTLGVYTGTNSYAMLSTSLKNPPTERHAHTACYIGRGCILIFGGQKPPTHSKDAFILDLVHDHWVDVPRMAKMEEFTWPAARRSHIMMIDEEDSTLVLQGGANVVKKIFFGNVCSMNVDSLFKLLEIGSKMPEKAKTTYQDKGQTTVTDEKDVDVNRETKLRKVEELTIKIRHHDTDSEAWADRCQAYIDMKLWSSALVDAEKGLQLLQRKPQKDLELELSRNKCTCLYYEKQYSKAIPILQEVVISYCEKAMIQTVPTVITITPNMPNLQAAKELQQRQQKQLEQFLDKQDHVLMTHLIPALYFHAKCYYKLGKKNHVQFCIDDCDKALERLQVYKQPSHWSSTKIQQRNDEWFRYYISFHKIKAKACVLQNEFGRAGALVEMASTHVQDAIASATSGKVEGDKKGGLLGKIFTSHTTGKGDKQNLLRIANKYKISLHRLGQYVNSQNKDNSGADVNYKAAIDILAEFRRFKMEETVLAREQLFSFGYRKIEVSEYTLGEEEYNEDDEDEPDPSDESWKQEQPNEPSIVKGIRLLRLALEFRREYKYLIALTESYMANSQFKHALVVANECVEKCNARPDSDLGPNAEPDAWKAYLLAGYCQVMLRHLKSGLKQFDSGLAILEKNNRSVQESDDKTRKEQHISAVLKIKDAQKDVIGKKNARDLGIQYYQKAHDLAQQGSHRDALLYFDKALDLDSRNGLYVAGKAQSLCESGELTEAFKEALKSTRLAKKKYFGYLAQARCLQRFRRYVAALDILESGLSIDPSNKDLQNEYKQVEEWCKKSQQAHMLYERAQFMLHQVEYDFWSEFVKQPGNAKFKRLGPKSRLTLTYKITLQQRESSLTESLHKEVHRICELLEEAISLYPHHYGFYMYQAKCEFLLRQYLKCVDASKKAMTLAIEDTLLFEKYRAAVPTAEPTHSTDVDDVASQAIILAAKSYASLRQFDLAINFIDQMVLEQYPDYAKEAIMISTPQEEQKNVTDKRRQGFDTVKQLQLKLSILKEEREHFEALRKRGRQILLEKKDYVDALVIFDTVVSQIENSASRLKELEAHEMGVEVKKTSTAVAPSTTKVVEQPKPKVEVIAPEKDDTSSSDLSSKSTESDDDSGYESTEDDRHKNDTSKLYVAQVETQQEEENVDYVEEFTDDVALDDDLEECAMAYYDRAECLYAMKRYEKCIKDCQQAIKLEPHYPHFYVLLCSTMLEQGQAQEALRLCTKALDDFTPFNSQLNDMWKKIRLFTCNAEATSEMKAAQELVQQAKSLSKELRQSMKQTEEVRTTTITTLRRPIGLKTSKSQESIKVDESSKKKAIEEKQQKIKDIYEQALQHMNASMALRPNDVDALLLRTRCFLKTNRPQKAIKDSRKAIQIDENNAQAVYYKGKSEMRKKELTHAKNTLKRGLDKFKKHDKMLSKFEEVLHLERQWHSAQHKCQDAEDAIARQNTDLAYQLFTEAIELHPTNAIYYCRRSRLLLSLSKAREALRDAKRALEVDPAEMESYVSKALAHLELCEYEEAGDTIQEGLHLDDTFDALHDLADELADREEKSSQAKEKHKQGQEYLKRVFQGGSGDGLTGSDEESQKGNILTNVVSGIGTGIASGSIGIMNLALGVVGLRDKQSNTPTQPVPSGENKEGILTRINDNLLNLNLLQLMRLKKQEQDIQEQQENAGLATNSPLPTPSAPKEIVVHNLNALQKAQQALLDSSNLEPLNALYLRDYVESLIVSQTQKDQRVKNDEAFYQSMGLIQLHPDYPEAYELFARINSTVYDDQYEALFVAVQGLEQDPRHLGLLHRLYSIIVDFEQVNMRDGGMLIQLRRSAKKKDDVDEDEQFEKEGEDIVNEALGVSDGGDQPKEKEMGSMSLADLLGDNDDLGDLGQSVEETNKGFVSDMFNTMFSLPTEVAGDAINKIKSLKILGGAQQQQQQNDRSEFVVRQAVTCVKGFAHGMYQNAVDLLHRQRDAAFDVALSILFIQFDKYKQIKEQNDRFQRLSQMLCRGMTVNQRTLDSKIANLERRGHKNVAVELINTFNIIVKEQEPTMLRVTSHKKRRAFYHKATFSSDRAFIEFKSQQQLVFDELTQRFEIEERDLKKHAVVETGVNSRARMQIIQFVVDGLYCVLEEEDDLEEKKRNEERQKRLKERQVREKKKLEVERKRLAEKNERLKRKQKKLKKHKKEDTDSDEEDEEKSESDAESNESSDLSDSEQEEEEAEDHEESEEEDLEKQEEFLESFRKSIIPISDDALYIMKAVSRTNGFGHVYPMLVLLEKLSRRFEIGHKSNSNLASDICNAYKTLLHIIQGVIDRSLTTIEQGEGMCLFVNTRESELFEMAQKRIMARCQTILDFHWRATTDKMQTILLFCVKVMELVHCFRVLGNNGAVLSEYLASLTRAPKRTRMPKQPTTLPKSISRDSNLGILPAPQMPRSISRDSISDSSGSPSKSVTKDDLEKQQVLSSIIYQKFLECLRNNSRNTMTYFKQKIITKYHKLEDQDNDDDDRLQPIHMLTLCSCIMEHLERYKSQFERCFPKSLNLMKNTVEIFYHLFEEEFEKFWSDHKQNKKITGTDGVPPGVLELPGKIDKLYEYFLEYSPNLRPYDITRLFLPFIYDWIYHYEGQLKKFADRAIEVDKWATVTEENDYTTSIIDLFTPLNQGMSFLKYHCEFLKKKAKQDGESAAAYMKSSRYTSNTSTYTGGGSNANNQMGNQLGNMPMVYFTYVDIACGVIIHYATKHYQIFSKYAKNLVKHQSEQIEKHKLNPNASGAIMKRLGVLKTVSDNMLTKMKNEIMGKFDENNEISHLQDFEGIATIKRMALCMNNIQEAITRLQLFSQEIQNQLVEENVQDEDEESSESEHDDLTHSGIDTDPKSHNSSNLNSSSSLRSGRSSKDNMVESLKMMNDTFKMTYRQMHQDMLSRGMMNFISRNVFDTIKNSLLTLIRNDGRASTSGSMMDRFKGIQEGLTKVGFDLPKPTLPQQPTIPVQETQEQAAMIERTFHETLAGVFSYLDEQLHLMVGVLNKDLFSQLLLQLFQSLSREIKEMIFPPNSNQMLSKRQVEYLLTTFKKFHKYFYAGGHGLDKTMLDRELAFLRLLMRYSLQDSKSLVAEHEKLSNKIRSRETKLDEKRLLHDTRAAQRLLERLEEDDDKDEDDDELGAIDDDPEDDLHPEAAIEEEEEEEEEQDSDSISEWDQQDEEEEEEEEKHDDERSKSDEDSNTDEQSQKSVEKVAKPSIKKLSIQERHENRIIRRNYIFAFLQRRAKNNDTTAMKRVRDEMQLVENAQMKLDTELQALSDAIERSKNDHKGLKDQVMQIDHENKILLKDYRMLKLLKNITMPHKQTRHENRQFQVKLAQEQSNMIKWNDKYDQIDKLLQRETKIFINQFSSRNELQLEKSLEQYVKDQLRLVQQDQQENREQSHLLSLGMKQAPVSTFLKTSSENAIRTFGLKFQPSQRLVISRYWRCLYQFVNGYLCILQEPEICLAFVPITDMRQLVTIGSGRSMLDLPRLILSFTDIASAQTSSLARKWQSSIIVTTRSNKVHEFHGLQDRSTTCDVIQEHISQSGVSSPNSDNMLKQVVNRVFGDQPGGTKRVHMTDDNNTSNATRGYPVSDSLRKKFSVLTSNERLMTQYFCKESTQKLPGNLYLFTNSLCFDTSVSSGGGSKFMCPFDRLAKISKIQKNAIKVSDKQGRTIVYSGIKERDEVFKEICETVERSTGGGNSHFSILYKQNGDIAVINSTQPDTTDTKNAGNLQRYAKYLKLDFT
jgi:tetratricopeptide (TPR) repeat protein